MNLYNVGFACGLILTCGCSTGGLDIIGLYLSKRGKGFTVGRFSLGFNAVLYTVCLFLFNASTAIYSAIYNVFAAMFLDRVHQQNIAVQMLIFTKDKRQIERVTHELSFGGGCINDVIIHLATSEMGFGGVGESGMGSYHGKAGFDTFSHYKSIVDKKTWIDLPMRYQPFNNKFYEKLLHIFLR